MSSAEGAWGLAGIVIPRTTQCCLANGFGMGVTLFATSDPSANKHWGETYSRQTGPFA